MRCDLEKNSKQNSEEIYQQTEHILSTALTHSLLSFGI